MYHSTETLSPELTADLAVSLQSIEEALRELLIAVDLSHVARATGQFIGYDSIAGSASAQVGKNGCFFCDFVSQ